MIQNIYVESTLNN